MFFGVGATCPVLRREKRSFEMDSEKMRGEVLLHHSPSQDGKDVLIALEARGHDGWTKRRGSPVQECDDDTPYLLDVELGAREVDPEKTVDLKIDEASHALVPLQLYLLYCTSIH